MPLNAVGADKIGLSDLPYFEQKLHALVHFLCEHILVTSLGNQLLQIRQA
jgi:hypothetical protein